MPYTLTLEGVIRELNNEQKKFNTDDQSRTGTGYQR